MSSVERSISDKLNYEMRLNSIKEAIKLKMFKDFSTLTMYHQFRDDQSLLTKTRALQDKDIVKNVDKDKDQEKRSKVRAKDKVLKPRRMSLEN